MMRAELYHVSYDGPGALSIMARPRGDDWLADELKAWREAGVDVAVSLLTPAEQAELGLNDEASLCQREGITFHSFPISDRDVPAQPPLASAFIDELVQALHAGKHVAIHCRMGIGRSAMIAAAMLVALGEAPERAFARIEAARGLAVPDTVGQRQWVKRYAAWRRPE